MLALISAPGVSWVTSSSLAPAAAFAEVQAAGFEGFQQLGQYGIGHRQGAHACVVAAGVEQDELPVADRNDRSQDRPPARAGTASAEVPGLWTAVGRHHQRQTLFHAVEEELMAAGHGFEAIRIGRVTRPGPVPAPAQAA